MEIRCFNCDNSSLEKINEKYYKCKCGKEYKLVEASETVSKIVKNSTKVFIAILVISLLISIIINKKTNASLQNYQKAIQLKNVEKYQEAKIIFSQLGEFIDSRAQIEICDKAISDNTNYVKALELIQNQKYQEAKGLLEKLDSFKDSKYLANECQNNIAYKTASNLMQSEKYEEAKVIFEDLGSFKDSKSLSNECKNNIDYKKALDYMNSGNYQFAKDIFNSLGDFKDSRDKIEHFDENIYNKAIEAKKQGNLEEAIKSFTYLKKYKDSSDNIKIINEINSIKNANIGEIVKYGNYEQDANEANGKEPIEWIVLDKKDDKVFLLSKYGLESKNYHDKYEYVVWEKSDIRKWLNDDLFEELFDIYEKESVLDSNVKQDKNKKYENVLQGDDTTDKLFLISTKEFEDYFQENKLNGFKICEPSEFIIKQKEDYDANRYDNKYWRLRTIGENPKYNAYVDDKGEIYYEGWFSTFEKTTKNKGLIRPAMWVKLEFNE